MATKKTSTPTKIPSRQTKTRSTINKALIRPRKSQLHQQNIEYNNQNTKYANQNTKYANQKFMLFCREAIFVANLRTFLAYFFAGQKVWWRTKKDKYNVCSSFRCNTNHRLQFLSSQLPTVNESLDSILCGKQSLLYEFPVHNILKSFI